jgi:hypothetical protein
MNRVDFLDSLTSFTVEAVKDVILPVRMQKGDTDRQQRAADVYRMRLPDGKAATKKAPYIIHQLVTGSDYQNQGDDPHHRTTVRTIFCVYSDDEQEGALMLLNLMERLRIRLLEQVILDKRYELDLKEKLETLIYPDDTAPYFAGEMVSVWKLPPVRRIKENILWREP